MTDKTAAQRILDAAGDLLAERGYGGMTTRALAERAGVNEVTIFRLFGSKLGVAAGWGERLMAEGAARKAVERPLPDDLRSAVSELAKREVAAAEVGGPAAMRLAFEARSVPELAAMLGEGPRANHEAMAAYFAEQQSAGRVRSDIDARLVSDAFFALTSTYVMSRMVMEPGTADGISSEKAVRQLVEVFLTGIETKG